GKMILLRAPTRSVLFQSIAHGSGLERTTEYHVLSRRFQRPAIVIASTLLIVAVAGGLTYLRAHRIVAPGLVPFSELLAHLDRGAVSAVVVNGDSLDFTLANGQTF